MKDLMSLLFETHAFKVAEENNPFWYTSGKIGPFFINADYLYGSEEDSKNLLEFIDSELENQEKTDIPAHIFNKVLDHYNSNEIYKFVIDEMKSYIEQNIDVNEIDYISGGERRDWYFSNLMAYLLDKPHVTIYKDLTTVVSDSKFTKSEYVSEIKGKKFLHLADLLNQSASFTRAWIPAIKNLGSNIVWSIFAVDRMQGGTETLTNDGVKVLSLLQIDDTLFTRARDLGIINDKQVEMLRNFKKDPDGSMKQFLIDHPEFIENALKSDNPRTVKRVNTLIEQDIYGLNLSK
jgi:orotate phosphoribosyltransferase